MSDTIQIKTKTIRNSVIVIVLIVGILTTYYFASSYLGNEVNIRKNRIADLQRELSIVENNLNGNLTLINSLKSQMELNETTSRLYSENQNLTIQKEDLETQVASLSKQVEDLRTEMQRLSEVLTKLGYKP